MKIAEVHTKNLLTMKFDRQSKTKKKQKEIRGIEILTDARAQLLLYC